MSTAGFFAERAYLPQSYLGQLLQIYQESASDANSPLAKFVGSLLGLDQLDALEAGLTPLMDVRNVRKYIEGWSDVELEKKQLDDLIKAQKQTRTQVLATFNKSLTSLSSPLQGLNIAIAPTTENLDAVEDLLAVHVEEGLGTYADRRRELAAILSESQTASEGGFSASEASLAAKQNQASEEYKAWQATYAVRFEAIQRSVTDLIPDVSLPSAIDEYANRVQTILSSMLSTASQQVLESRRDVRRLNDAEDELAVASERLEAIETEMAQFARDSGELAKALAEISSFVADTEFCPVCDRDFSELAHGSLSNHVHSRIRSLSDSAERLLTLGRARSEAQRLVDDLTDEVSSLTLRAIDAEELAGLEKQAGRVKDVLGELQSLSPILVDGARLPPSSTQRLQPKLITEHRDGGDAGGTPGAMLSAGNLNTAALTLFIALHLSVPAQFPCLILDDPVQSMDDVHIAHFASLLRTLSKEHGRQVMIAVHDRQLFDYLKLELSPAYPGDSLLTLELTRGNRRDTNCQPERFSFRDEDVLFAAA